MNRSAVHTLAATLLITLLLAFVGPALDMRPLNGEVSRLEFTIVLWLVLFLIGGLLVCWLCDDFAESCLQVESIFESHGLNDDSAVDAGAES